MKHAEEIMEILEAFDLTQCYRDAGELAGCDHKTVAHWVARRDAGELTATAEPRDRVIDPFRAKLEEWMKEAAEQPGSWWPTWQSWVEKYAGAKIPAPKPGDGELNILGDAPGKYVLVKAGALTQKKK